MTQDRRDLLIDKQTKFPVLLEFAQEDLKKRFSVKTSQSKKTQIWRHVKSSLEKFCQVVYHYSSVMDVLVSAHPEIAALACKLLLLVVGDGMLSNGHKGVRLNFSLQSASITKSSKEKSCIT